MSSLGAMFDAIVRAGRSDMIWFLMACGAQDYLAAKCAGFSISQMSCSSAGPRGPAVIMLVLSATGSPVRS
jgi:hypothetical protein